MNWKWGTAFGIMTVVTIVSIVYALVQQTVAEASRREAEKQFEIAQSCSLESDKQKKISEETMIQLQHQQLAAEEYKIKLEQCRSKK